MNTICLGEFWSQMQKMCNACAVVHITLCTSNMKFEVTLHLLNLQHMTNQNWCLLSVSICGAATNKEREKNEKIQILIPGERTLCCCHCFELQNQNKMKNVEIKKKTAKCWNLKQNSKFVVPTAVPHSTVWHRRTICREILLTPMLRFLMMVLTSMALKMFGSLEQWPLIASIKGNTRK